MLLLLQQIEGGSNNCSKNTDPLNTGAIVAPYQLILCKKGAETVPFCGMGNDFRPWLLFRNCPSLFQNPNISFDFLPVSAFQRRNNILGGYRFSPRRFNDLCISS